jgi:hypothetical protein
VLALACLAAAAVLLTSWPPSGPIASAVGRAAPVQSPYGQGGDASWPNCGHPLDSTLVQQPAFAIVGVNNGTPGTRSACLSRTLTWARTAVGGTDQPRVAYYVMVADPWAAPELRHNRPAWPSSDTVRGSRVAVPAAYGPPCRGGHASAACAYVFGWASAARSAALPGVSIRRDTIFWLDVEEERDFSGDQRFNQALVEGTAAYFLTPRARGGLGTRTGIYSNAYYWTVLIGELRRGSPLAALDEWYPIGTGTAADAAAAFESLAPFVPGARIRIVQTVQGRADVDYAPAG